MERRSKLSTDEMEGIAEMVAQRVRAEIKPCLLSLEEHAQLREVIRAKKGAVRVTLAAAGLIAAWVLNDVYHTIVGLFRKASGG